MTADGAFFVLLPHGPADEDASVIAWGRATDAQLTGEALTEPLDVRSLIATSGAWTEHADAIALGADGEVLLMKGERVVVEHVRGSESKKESRTFLGHMTRLQQVGDALFAVGYGGQVYVRKPDDAWRPVSTSAPRLPHYGICFYGVVPSSRGLVCFGTHVGENAADEEQLDALADAGDFDRYAELMLEGNRPNTMALWRCEDDGAWRQLQAPQGTSVFSSWSGADGHLLFVDTGEVLRTRDFETFEAHLSLASAADDVDGTAEQLVLLIGDTVFEYARGALSKVGPPFPAGAQLLSVSVVDDAMAVFSDERLWVCRRGAASWRLVEVSSAK